MRTRALRPWTDLIKLHPDVEAAALKKLVANWRALIDHRLAMDEGTLFDTRER